MIWVIGGTKDSRDFLERFAPDHRDIVVTTATEYGGKLLEGLPVKIVSAKLTLEEMRSFVEENSIHMIVDMSHPYASEVSKNAIEISKECEIEYYRFEREEISLYPERYSEFTDISDLINYCENCEGNILVTLGSNSIEKFSFVKNLSKYYFRILPKWEMVKKCEDIGVLPKNIIAIQGPFTQEMNEAMIEQLNIKYLVSKKAGATGGELEKIKACDSKKIEVVFLDKPKVKYPNQCSSIEKLIEMIK